MPSTTPSLGLDRNFKSLPEHVLWNVHTVAVVGEQIDLDVHGIAASGERSGEWRFPYVDFTPPLLP